jgi:wyosine [tRNA(Phe)-imidazoG37] synthetase (radical SAM superfamily)
MATFLFDEIIFGPVKSRRLGVSLGINLLPVNKKICSFDCIYCECGLNTKADEKAKLPTQQQVQQLLEQKLIDMGKKKQHPDVITFAGNGEPTLHPNFADIIDDTLALRNQLCPNARVAVLSNASSLNNDKVKHALLKIDDNILKLDSGLESTIINIDRPNTPFKLATLVENLKWFNGNLIIQTLFLKGNINGTVIDNTQEEDVTAWLEILNDVKPKSVMIYTISRDTPFDTLQKVTLPQLEKIALRVKQLGIDVQVSG